MSAVAPSIPWADAPAAKSRSAITVATAGMIIAFAAVWLMSLNRSLCDPLGPDQAFFQYIAQGILAGQTPYVDVQTQDGPSILVAHLLSTLLFGPTDLGVRAFDACWTAMTLAALIALALRDRRPLATGLLAGTLYACIYYGQGYIFTCQRDGFGVLPALLAIHCMISNKPSPVWRAALRGLVAGLFGAVAFQFKPTLGLCFGMLWLQACADAWHHRTEGLRATAVVTGLTAGFLATVLTSFAILYCWGSWDAYWQVLTRRHPLMEDGYVMGPYLLLEMRYRTAWAGVMLAAVLGVLFLMTWSREAQDRGKGRRLLLDWAWWVMAGTGLFLLMITAHFWPDWRCMLVVSIGAIVPALGFALSRPWRDLSRTQWLVLMNCGAGMASILIQGQFAMYHLFPLAAFASYLAACEVTDGFRRFRPEPNRSHPWLVVCLSLLLFTGYTQWWRCMTRFSASLNPLEGRTLVEHYAHVTRKMNAPAYETKLRVARRLQELTAPNEPITIMFFDLWLYQMCNRPPAMPKVYIHADTMRNIPATIDSVLDRKPRILLARLRTELPAEKRSDPTAVFATLVGELETYFGAPAQQIGTTYRLIEMIDDVGFLERLPGT